MDNRRKFEAYAKLRRDRRDHGYFRNVYRGLVHGVNGTKVEVRDDVLRSAYNAWAALADWRELIDRNERYVFGDQFADLVYDPDCGRWYTERQMYEKKGVNPSQYNIIRSILRSVQGVYSSNKTVPNVVAQSEEMQGESDVLTVALKGVYNREEMHALDMHELLQLMVCGGVMVKTNFVNRDGRSDVVVDYISPRNFFVDNHLVDPRGRGCTLVGCFYDLSLDDVVSMFSFGDKKRAERLVAIYRYADTSDERVLDMCESLTGDRRGVDFFAHTGVAERLARVIEVWRKESAECFWVHDYLSGEYYPDFDRSEAELRAVNEARMMEQGSMGVAEEDMLLLEYEWGVDSYWKCYYLSPWGEVLWSGVNPYWHEDAPIVFRFHDFFDGKIYPFVTDLIDANRQINRLSAISDLLVKYSAKNLLFVPTDTVDEEAGYDLDYIAEEYSGYDGVIPYKPSRTGERPYSVSTIMEAYGPLQVVNIFLAMSEKVSGVYGALQGQQPLSGTPASMYAQQSQNSATSLNALFDAFDSFRVNRDKQVVALMQQYYTGKRYVYDKTSGRQMVFSHDDVKNLDVEVSVVENKDTPAYRLMINDVLMQLKQFDQQNLLDLRGMIEVGNYPFKDKLLAYLNKRDEEMAQGMEASAMPPELQQEMAGYGLNPEVAQAMNDELKAKGVQ